MTKLLIVRHGNTFDKGDTPVRVGLKTDLPLSLSGQAQAKAFGEYISNNNIKIEKIFCSELQRTQQTAQLAMDTAGIEIPIEIDPFLNEIDYGPDEAKPEAQVIARIGEEALMAWENKAKLPKGWICDIARLIQDWKKFADSLIQEYPDQTVMVISSNGIIRFALPLLNDFTNFNDYPTLKVKTGSISCLQSSPKGWTIEYWDERP